MKIRSLLLGSVAAAGLATTGFAADLGVVTSLDICDELGISGLTISSDDNCLLISGGVSFEYNIGDYAPAHTYADLARTPLPAVDDVTFIDNGGGLDSSADVDAWLKFVGSANSDFGMATATIKLISENNTGTADWTVGIDEAWVGIGDTTQLMAGYKGSIFDDGDDMDLGYLQLFNSEAVDDGVGGLVGHTPVTGGDVIQVVSSLGNGLTIKAGLENLGKKGPPAGSLLTAVGVLQYAGDGITAHISGDVDTTGHWLVHSGFKGTWDPITVVAAVAAGSHGWWNALGSVSATFDMFTIAASGEATSAGEWGVGGSISAAVSDGVKVNLGSRLFNGVGANDVWQVEAGVSAAVTETITITAAVGAFDGNQPGDPMAFYGKAGLAWNPGGNFKASLDGQANTLGGYKATFKASKDIK